MTLCSVDGCNSRASSGISFFRCPKDEPRCQRWKKSLGFIDTHRYANLTPEQCNVRIKVCSLHFYEASFVGHGTATRLHYDAVPSLNLLTTNSNVSLNTESEVKVYRDVSVATEYLESEGTTCKARWNNIRDQYRKSLKKMITKSGQKSKVIKHYKYGQELSFLKAFFQDKTIKENLDNENEEIGVSSAEDEKVTLEDAIQAQSLENSVDSAVTPFSYSASVPSPYPVTNPPTDPLTTPLRPPSPPSSVMSRKNKSSANPKMTAAASLIEYLLAKHASSEPQHPIDAFLAGMAPTLKNLDPHHQNLAKSEIFSVVQKYEMKMFMENQHATTFDVDKE